MLKPVLHSVRNKLFRPKYKKYDYKFVELSPQDLRTIETISKDIKDYIKRTPKVSNVDYHTRDAHAKGYCAVKAQFEILNNLPEEYAQGFYARAGKHDAVIRFSNGAPHIDADKRLGLGQGMGIKVFDVPGRKMVPDEQYCTTFDYNLINVPVFFCNRIQDYAYISRIFMQLNKYAKQGAVGRTKLAFNWLTAEGTSLPTKESLKTFKALDKFTSIEPKNSLLYGYYSQGAVRHGDYMAKIRVQPTKASADSIIQKDLDLNARDEAIRPILINEIRAHDVEFEVQIQLCRNLKDQPIDDLTKEWTEDKAPFVTVAKLTIPKQHIPDDGNFDIMEHLSFTPFRTLEANRPIGNLQQARLKAYQTASVTRHKLNNVKREEPTSLEQVFSKDFY